ncbi:hypothetical protein BT96DRAFT_1005133 [Gymnopus androsaceus JB14]|uniref:Uncharacterized protein n=1 Tax=Gymnopus androsaceus JB14 TaxID=1447944 RepID=A0A6A4GQ60_9AGAR|nr:hypothetical protein BT96DRAFT_1005133 [Gymnopus androsaceus JB14]
MQMDIKGGSFDTSKKKSGVFVKCIESDGTVQVRIRTCSVQNNTVPYQSVVSFHNRPKPATEKRLMVVAQNSRHIGKYVHRWGLTEEIGDERFEIHPNDLEFVKETSEERKFAKLLLKDLRAEFLRNPVETRPADFLLFGYINDSGKPQHMVKSTFLAFCNAIWKGKGLLNVQGHSFRIGGAVELLIAKVPPEVVAAIGGWTSLAFHIYWHHFEEILPAHILKAYNPDQISRLKSTLDDYHKVHKIPDSLIDSCINGINIADFE